MRRAASLAVLALLALSVFESVGVVEAQTAQITVQVTDQYGVLYNGVVVQITATIGTAQSSGTTSNGIFISSSLPDNANYVVFVTTSTARANKTVLLGTSNLFVSFVLTRPTTPQVALTSVAYSPTSGTPGGSMTATIRLTTQNAATAYYVTLSLSPTSPIGISGGGSVFYFGTLSGSTSTSQSLVFEISPGAVPANYGVGYVIFFANSAGTGFNNTGTIYVPVGPPQPPPQVAVTSVTQSPVTGTPGGNVTETLTLTNSNSAEAFNVILSFTNTFPLTVASHGTDYYLGNILGLASVNVVVNLYVDPTAVQSNYPLPYTIFYASSSGGSASTSGQISVPVGPPLPPPQVAVTNVVLTPTSGTPGGNLSASLTLTNSNSAEAFNVILSFTNTFPLTVASHGTVFYLGNIIGLGKVNVVVNLYVDPTALQSDYPLPYTISYASSSGGSASTLGEVSVPVTFAPQHPKLLLTSLITNPATLIPGEIFTATATIENAGNQPAYGAIMAMSPGTGIHLVGSAGTVNLGNLAVNQTVSASFQMQVIPSTGSVVVPFTFTFTYSGSLGAGFTDTGSVTVNVNAFPQLQFGSFTLASSPLRPGVSTTFAVSILNIGGDAAYNVSISLNAPKFVLGNSSNYIGSISPASSAATTFFVSVPNSTLTGNYIFGMSVKYQDFYGKNYQTAANYSLSIQAYSPPMVELTGTILNPPVLSPGSSGTLTLFLKNTGQTDATNVQINVYNAQGILAQSFFGLGSMTAGSSVTQVVGVNLASNLKLGSYTLHINATFDDPSGKQYHSSAPLQTNIYGAYNVFSLTNIALGVVLVLAVIVGYLLLRRYKVL